MTKIDQIETAAQAAIDDDDNFDAFMELYGPITIIKMCAVIKAAERMSHQNTADTRKVFWSKLQELNND